jgi:hypothetical protein
MGQDTAIHIVVSVCVEWKWENADIIQKIYNISKEYESNYYTKESIDVKVKDDKDVVENIEDYGKSEELVKCINKNKKERWDKIKEKYGKLDIFFMYDCCYQYDGWLSSATERHQHVIGNYDKTPKETIKQIKKGRQFFIDLGFAKNDIRLSYLLSDSW